MTKRQPQASELVLTTRQLVTEGMDVLDRHRGQVEIEDSRSAARLDEIHAALRDCAERARTTRSLREARWIEQYLDLFDRKSDRFRQARAREQQCPAATQSQRSATGTFRIVAEDLTPPPAPPRTLRMRVEDCAR